jgi:hypothetical protein
MALREGAPRSPNRGGGFYIDPRQPAYELLDRGAGIRAEPYTSRSLSKQQPNPEGVISVTKIPKQKKGERDWWPHEPPPTDVSANKGRHV